VASIQTKAPSISCKQQRPALSLALRAGHHNSQDLEDNGAGQGSHNDDVDEHNSMITSYEFDGMITSTFASVTIPMAGSKFVHAPSENNGRDG